MKILILRNLKNIPVESTADALNKLEEIYPQYKDCFSINAIESEGKYVAVRLINKNLRTPLAIII